MKTLLVVPLMLTAASLAQADLMVSGDSNLGNGIDGSSGSAVIAGNKTFFSNLLGAGTKVVFQTTTNLDSTEAASSAAIINYYTGLGKTVTQTATVTNANLAGANLLISFLQDVPYTAAEMSAIQSFLASGGNVLLTGEYIPFDPNADANINALLTFLGSPMSLGSTEIDAGFHTATGGQIAATPYTAGVTQFSYAATTSVSGGTPVFLTTTGVPFIEYTTTSAAVPEPSSVVMLLSILVVAGFVIRRRATV